LTAAIAEASRRSPDIRRNLFATLGLSLLLHVAVILWLGFGKPDAVLPIRTSSPAIEWTEWEDVPPAAAPSPNLPARAASPRSASPPAQSLTPSPGVASQIQDAPAGASGQPSDARLNLDLLPRSDWSIAPSEHAAEPGSGRGVTVRNDAAHQRAVEEEARARLETTRLRITGEMNDAVDEAKRAAGLVSPAFTQQLARLNDALARDKPQFDVHGNALQEMAGAWAPVVSQYGKTGSAAKDPSQTRALEETPFGRSVTQMMGPQVPHRHLQQHAVESMAAGQLFLESARRIRLQVRVALVHNASGERLESEVLNPSGHRAFDEFALKAVHEVDGSALVRHESLEGGRRLRSVWELTYRPGAVRASLVSKRVLPAQPEKQPVPN